MLSQCPCPLLGPVGQLLLGAQGIRVWGGGQEPKLLHSEWSLHLEKEGPDEWMCVKGVEAHITASVGAPGASPA